jgi:acyl carrier protein
MKEQIIDILKSVLEDSSVNELTSRENYGNWDSMHHLMIAVELESQFGVELQPEDIEAMQSVGDIERIITSKK